MLSLQEEELNIKKILLDGWAKKMVTRTDAIHVSDLIFCARKNCYSRLTPITPVLTKKKTEVNAHMILGGELAHLKLQSLLAEGEFKCEQEVVYICKDGTKVVGHIDAIHIPSNTCIEFKTTESVSVVENCYPYNLVQLLYYMAINNSRRGVLLYLILGNTRRTTEYFPEYHIEISDPQRDYLLSQIEEKAMNLNAGIISENPELVEHSAGHSMFMNKFGDSWLCESCPFKKVCTGYQRRFKQAWTEEDERQELNKIMEELKGKFKIFFPSKV